jgi:hypothetical protein
MVSFASKSADIRADLVRSTSGAQWLRTVRDGKDLRVRFLQDPEDWDKYKEHYGQSAGFFPCTQDARCPGCTSDDERMKKASRRYISQVLIVQEEGAQDVGKVAALKMPLDLANRVVNKCDRNGGTLLNRDYTLIRTGNGLDTEYDVEVEDKSTIDLNKFEHVDVEGILTSMFESAWGAPSQPKPAKTEAKAEEDDKPPF